MKVELEDMGVKPEVATAMMAELPGFIMSPSPNLQGLFGQLHGEFVTVTPADPTVANSKEERKFNEEDFKAAKDRIMEASQSAFNETVNGMTIDIKGVTEEAEKNDIKAIIKASIGGFFGDDPTAYYNTMLDLGYDLDAMMNPKAPEPEKPKTEEDYTVELL